MSNISKMSKITGYSTPMQENNCLKLPHINTGVEKITKFKYILEPPDVSK